MLRTVMSGGLPLLVVLTGCGEAKVMVAGVTAANGGAAAPPVPVSVTVWVAPTTLPELSVIIIVPERGPAAAGVKLTWILQGGPPAGIERPAVQVVPATKTEKSPGLAPPKVMGVDPRVKVPPVVLALMTMMTKALLRVFTV